MAKLFKPQIVRYLDAEGKRVKKDTPGARKVKEKASKWWGKYRDPNTDREERVPLFIDKKASQQRLNDLVKQSEWAKAGLTDPKFEEHARRPLAEHLANFRTALKAKANTADYVALVVGRLEAVMNSCRWQALKDLSMSQADEWLVRQRGEAPPELPPEPADYAPGVVAKMLGVSLAAVRAAINRHGLRASGKGRKRRYPRATVQALVDRQGQGSSAQTRNYYRAHLRTFGNWLVKDTRICENPFRHLEVETTATDRRHDRRELEADELPRLLHVARDSAKVFRGLSGPDRFHLDATACGTGFRAAALASLTPESFDLDADTPTVTLAARKPKNRKRKVQPLPADLAVLLGKYLEGKPAGQPVWGGTWARDHRGAELLRGDRIKRSLRQRCSLRDADGYYCWEACL